MHRPDAVKAEKPVDAAAFGAAPARAPQRILLIDDNPDDRRLSERELRREFPDLQIDHIADGREFTEALEHGDFDLVITDFQLRWSDGLEVLLAVRSRYPHRPVIMFTATATQETAVQAMKSGLTDYVVKSPRHFARLPAAVSSALGQTRQRRALAEAENRFRHLFETVPVGLWRADEGGRLSEVNAAMVQTFCRQEGWSLLGRSIIDLLADQQTKDQWARAVAAGAPMHDFEAKMVTSDGAEIWARINAHPSPRAPGGFAYEGSLEDVTARKLAVLALEASEQRLRAILDNATAVVYLKDLRGRYLFINRRFEVLFGVSREAVAGRQDQDLFAPDIANGLVENDRRVIEAGAPLEFEEVVRQSGEPRSFISVKFPLRETAGAIYAVCSISTDITDWKRAQATIRETQSELRIARDIQSRLYPEAPPPLERFDVAGATRAAQAVGGDYYDFLPMRRGRWGIVVGDAAGHGLGPSLLMAETRTCLHTLARGNERVDQILYQANHVLARSIPPDRFVTLTFVELDPRRGTVTYSNAGHPTGFLIAADGSVRAELESTSYPLGVTDDGTFPAGPKLRLCSGELLLLYTDGVTEAMHPDEREMFGVRRALDVVVAVRRRRSSEIIAALFEAVDRFREGRPHFDDVTAVVIRAV